MTIALDDKLVFQLRDAFYGVWNAFAPDNWEQATISNVEAVEACAESYLLKRLGFEKEAQLLSTAMKEHGHKTVVIFLSTRIWVL